MIKFCPDLIGKEEVKAVFIGHGDYVVPTFNPRLLEKCAAYKNGVCKKYDNDVEIKTEDEKI